MIEPKTTKQALAVALGLTVVVAVSVTSGVAAGYYAARQYPVKQEPTAYEACHASLVEFSAFYKALDSVGQIPYDSDFATCYDHSQSLSKALAEQNIKSSILVNGDRSHAWVAVWVEANTGQFVPMSDDSTILEVRDGVEITNVQCYNNAL